MSSPEPTLESLAASISEATKGLAAYLKQNGHPEPSFKEGGLEHYPKDPQVAGLRFHLIQAISDLNHLVLGAAESVFVQPLFWNHDPVILDVLNQFDFFGAVPVGGSATYEEISQRTTLPESIVRRILRYSTAIRLFDEQPPASGNIVHTSTTAFVAKNPAWKSWISHNLEEVRPSSVHAVESLKKFSAGKPNASDSVLESGFALADVDRLGYPLSYWDWLMNTPEGKPEGYRTARFAESMQVASSTAAVGSDQLLSAYDWASLGEATVVDIGGSGGHDAILLANKFPSLKFIVQDLPENEAKFQTNLPAELAQRVSFQTHDFFTPQPVADAKVYLLKLILHDWPDKDASAILRNLIPTLGPDDRIVLCESLFPSVYDEQGNRVLPLVLQRMLSCGDMQMLVAFNNLERSMEQWGALLKQADERLEIRSVLAIPGAVQSIIEVGLKK